MTENARKHWALRFRELLNNHVPRKLALLQVRREIREAVALRVKELVAGGCALRRARKLARMPSSRSSVYAWCAEFRVSTR